MQLKQGHMKMVSKFCHQKFRLRDMNSFFFKYLNKITIQPKNVGAPTKKHGVDLNFITHAKYEPILK